MKRLCIVCVLLLCLKIETVSWAALVVLMFCGGWALLNRGIEERERRYE